MENETDPEFLGLLRSPVATMISYIIT